MNLSGVDGITLVVAWAVLDIGDELGAVAFGAAELGVHGAAQEVNEVDVLPLVPSADAVGFAVAPLVVDLVDGRGVVLDVEPVARVLAVAINRQRLALYDVVNHQRNQLLRKVVWPIVVGAVRQNHRKPVGLVVGAHKVVAAGLRRTVGTVGAVGSFFVKKTLGAKGTKNLVRRNMVEALALHGPGPGSAGRVEQVDGADYVGFYKGHWVGNGTIHMTFCG